jgi:hypothetical protein
LIKEETSTGLVLYEKTEDGLAVIRHLPSFVPLPSVSLESESEQRLQSSINNHKSTIEVLADAAQFSLEVRPVLARQCLEWRASEGFGAISRR